VQVKNYLTREDVSFLTNVEIAVPRDALPKLDTGEIYYHDLIGLTVYNQNNDCLGKVVEILPTGANDVIVISGEKRTLVPLVWDVFIKHVDLTKGLMNIHWDLED
jgi:16S rRNA processing protein RimM